MCEMLYIGMNFQSHSSYPKNVCCYKKSTRETNLLMVWWTCSCFPLFRINKITAYTTAAWFRMKNVKCSIHLQRKSDHCLHNSIIYNNLYSLPSGLQIFTAVYRIYSVCLHVWTNTGLVICNVMSCEPAENVYFLGLAQADLERRQQVSNFPVN